MRAIVKQPGEPAEVFELERGLAPLQAVVEGTIATVYVPDLDAKGVTIWANDDGLLLGMKPNLGLGYSVLVGPVCFTGHNAEGETVGLTESQVGLVMALIS